MFGVGLKGIGLSLAGTVTPSAGGSSSFTDNFNRANENLEASANWTRVDGAATTGRISSNGLGSFTTTVTAYQCPDQGSLNQYTQISFTAFAASPGGFIACRLQDKDNFIGMVANATGTKYEVWRCVAGVFTNLLSISTTQTPGDVGRLEVTGSNWRFLLNGIQQGTGAIGDGGALTSTRSGVVLGYATQDPEHDNFEAGAL